MHYEIIIDGVSAYGPAPWSADHALSALYERGYVLESGLLDGVRFPLDAPGQSVTVGPVQIVVSAEPESPPPPVAPPQPRTMTKYAFRTRVLTFAERMTLDNSAVPELVTMRNDLAVAEVVDLDEVAKYRPIMLTTGLASEERIDEIISGVTHA